MRIHRLLIAAVGLMIVPTVLLPRLEVARHSALLPKAEAQQLPLLHPLFTDDAVLQRDRSIPIWGWTAPSGNVTVKVDGKNSETKADESGRWMLRIGPYPAGGPHSMNVSSANDTITRQNILFGDVWLCSGQSNMEAGMGMINDSAQEIAAANFPNIRLFSVPNKVASETLKTVDSKWQVCTSANVATGGWNGFSAVAYFFGRKLHQELKVPIGLIDSSVGGTPAESWMSEAALGALNGYSGPIAGVKQAGLNSDISFDDQTNGWWETTNPATKHDFGTKNKWFAPELDDSKWKTINAPGVWEKSGVPEMANFDGVAWYRRKIDVPANWEGQELTLKIGTIDNADTTYWNGQEIGSTDNWNAPRTYKISGQMVKAGRNTISVRVVDSAGEGGITGTPEQMRLERSTNEGVSLAGEWKIKTSASSTLTTVFYNGMIAPLQPFALKGAIWYQGEGDTWHPDEYSRLLPALITDWRIRFDSTLPFYIVQLSAFTAPDEKPHDSPFDWARLRESQWKTATTVPNSGIAVTVDIGQQDDPHPKNKQDVGLRLALNALAKDYGQKVEYRGPILKSMQPEGANLVLILDHAEGGLAIKGEKERFFAIAGEDKQFYWATPKVEGNKILLSAPEVKAPVAARYNWSNFPRGFIYNGANLPAVPFRTDQW